MANETGAVPPALTAAEWAELAAGESVGICVHGAQARPGRLSLYDEGGETHFDAADLPKLVALANAARDDADPGKLTWADVRNLREQAPLVALEGYELAAELMRSTADAIAALLPPREGA